MSPKGGGAIEYSLKLLRLGLRTNWRKKHDGPPHILVINVKHIGPMWDSKREAINQFGEPSEDGRKFCYLGPNYKRYSSIND